MQQEQIKRVINVAAVSLPLLQPYRVWEWMKPLEHWQNRTFWENFLTFFEHMKTEEHELRFPLPTVYGLQELKID